MMEIYSPGGLGAASSGASCPRWSCSFLSFVESGGVCWAPPPGSAPGCERAPGAPCLEEPPEGAGHAHGHAACLCGAPWHPSAGLWTWADVGLDLSLPGIGISWANYKSKPQGVFVF